MPYIHGTRYTTISRGANVASWTPAAFGSALKWWMDPTYAIYTDAGTTPAVNDGDSIYRWICRASGNVFDQATAGLRPQLKIGANGKQYVDFIDKTRFLSCSAPTGLPAGNSARSFALGFKATVGAANSVRYIHAYGQASDNLVYALDIGDAGNARIVGYNNDTTITGMVYATGSWVKADCTFDGTTLSLRKDAGTPVTATPTAFNTTVGIAQLNRFVDADNGTNGLITHFMMTNTKFSADELASVQAFLTAQQPT
jgi:hypothetical protein